MNKKNHHLSDIHSGTKKSLGQHFLSDSHLLEAIADHAAIQEQGSVIEIGTGLGTLTEILAQRASCVVTIELDDDLIPVLRLSLAKYDHVKLIHGDFLKLPWETLTGDLKDPIQVVGNIPYYITTDIIKSLFGKERLFSVTLLVQKEVGLKLTASPREPSYCLMSLLTAYYSVPSYCMDVSRSFFTPPPSVDNCVIHMQIRQDRFFGSRPSMEKLFLKICSSLFYMRRKTVRNNLTACFRLDAALAERLLSESGIDPKARGEALELSQLYLLTEKLADVLRIS